MKKITERLGAASLRGLKAGLRTGLWISRMMLPITLGVALLKWLGVIEWMTQWLTPVFHYIGLTGEGVLVFLTSIFASLYAAIAVIATFDMDFRSVTILAAMGLICHNLIIETVIQRKAGANPVAMVVLRIGAAIVAAGAMNALLPADFSGRLVLDHIKTTADAVTLSEVLWNWVLSMAQLLPFMFGLILLLNVLQQVLREFSLIELLTRPIAPLIRAMGLPEQTSFLWIVMNTLGLAYGGAVLIAEVGNDEISHRDARLLNTHIALNHSLVEDSFLFLAIGVGLFWIVVPRVVLAIAAVWTQRWFYRMKDKKALAQCSIR